MRQKELEEEEAALDNDDSTSDPKNGSRMLRDEVTPDDIASVVASWTGWSLHMHLGDVSFFATVLRQNLAGCVCGSTDLICDL